MKKTITWNRFFVRHGWNLVDRGEGVFNCNQETEANLNYLLDSLNQSAISYEYDGLYLSFSSQLVDEETLILAMEYRNRGETEQSGAYYEGRPLCIRELDTYMAGVIRQLNRLQFSTILSCDGHERRRPQIYVSQDQKLQQLNELLLALGCKISIRESSRNHSLSIHCKRTELLNLAEVLHVVEVDWLGKGMDFIKKRVFENTLEELLSIPGESGNEREIRHVIRGNRV